ncbi:caspase family protein [Streptomyces sp. TRM75563]|uniref:VMAP-C domain-containing protein n=1 Tax=Streptomyces sp. TRM75563 TaxID=2817418 RepID=UPI001F61DB54|nr:caspase family protein [Streptomyces sp. TRM75563]MCI4042487.1 caspase family protein [Streptomyces sp. TRM75563]
MTAPHDWQRTHAVIVAVEAYADQAWNLSGPASDAARMMRWLRARGVPESGMHLLASPLEQNEGILADFTGVTRSTADRAHVRRVFRKELLKLEVDWLWVYWAGHGLKAGGNRWSLLYPDTQTGDPLGVDADNLVSLLRTAHLPALRPERVTMVIDACQSTLSAGQQARALDPERIAAFPEKGARKLFVMRASRPGEAAKNRDGTGVFTSYLMDHLEAGSRKDSAAAPDLGQVWAEMMTKFELRKATEGGGQTPTVHLRDWNDNELVYTGTTVGASALGSLSHEQELERQQLALRVEAAHAGDPGAAARLAAAVSKETGTAPPCSADELTGELLVDWSRSRPHGISTLIHHMSGEACGVDGATLRRHTLHLTRGRWLLCSEYDALSGLLAGIPDDICRALVAAARAEAPAAVIDEVETLALIDHLEDLDVVSATFSRLPRLIGAVERFAAAVGGKLAEQLREWTLNCAIRLGSFVPQLLQARRLELEERAESCAGSEGGPTIDDRIQIRLSAATGTSRARTLQAWSRGSTAVQSLATYDTELSEPEIRRAVDDLLTRYGRANVTWVEFFLDLADLELDVHRWEIGAEELYGRPMGNDFPVVVRCAEQRVRSREHLWRQRWKRVESGRTQDLHWLSAGPTTIAAVHGALAERDDAPGVVVRSVGEGRTAAFGASVFNGVPVMIWRSGPEAEGIETELTSFLEGDALASLPDKLRRIRAGSAADEQRAGGRLALLWDDPQHPLPPRLDLAAP